MSLADYLNTAKTLSWLEILQLGQDTGRGLAVAHKKGMFHRDIKPANIYLETIQDPTNPDKESTSTAARTAVEAFGHGLSLLGLRSNSSTPSVRNRPSHS